MVRRHPFIENLIHTVLHAPPKLDHVRLWFYLISKPVFLNHMIVAKGAHPQSDVRACAALTYCIRYQVATCYLSQPMYLYFARLKIISNTQDLIMWCVSVLIRSLFSQNSDLENDDWCGKGASNNKNNDGIVFESSER